MVVHVDAHGGHGMEQQREIKKNGDNLKVEVETDDDYFARILGKNQGIVDLDMSKWTQSHIKSLKDSSKHFALENTDVCPSSIHILYILSKKLMRINVTINVYAYHK